MRKLVKALAHWREAVHNLEVEEEEEEEEEENMKIIRQDKNKVKQIF